jgi:hypothetical protein
LWEFGHNNKLYPLPPERCDCAGLGRNAVAHTCRFGLA